MGKIFLAWKKIYPLEKQKEKKNICFPIKKGTVTDKEIKMKMGGCSEESEVVRTEKEINKVIRSIESLFNKEDKEEILTEDERKFLIDIAKNPISGVVARYARLSINRYQGNKIQKELLEKNMISWKPVSTKRGRLKVLVLTEKGKKAISDVKIEKVFHKQGSWEHEYWKYRVGEHYKKRGYKVTFEYKIGDGKSVDVVAEKVRRRIAVEIETGKSDAIYNIKKDLEVGFDKIIIVPLSDSLETKLIEQIKNFDERIMIKNVKNFRFSI